MKDLVTKINEALGAGKITIDNFKLFFDMCKYVQEDKTLKDVIDVISINRENSNGNSTIMLYNVENNSIEGHPLNDFAANFSINSKKQLLYKGEKIEGYYGKGLTVNNPETIVVSITTNWDKNKNWSASYDRVKDKLSSDKYIESYGTQYPIFYKLEEDDYYTLFDLALETWESEK